MFMLCNVCLHTCIILPVYMYIHVYTYCDSLLYNPSLPPPPPPPPLLLAGIPSRPDPPTVTSDKGAVIVMATTAHSGVRDSNVDNFHFILQVRNIIYVYTCVVNVLVHVQYIGVYNDRSCCWVHSSPSLPLSTSLSSFSLSLSASLSSFLSLPLCLPLLLSLSLSASLSSSLCLSVCHSLCLSLPLPTDQQC